MPQDRDVLHERARALFQKISKRANLHGHEFTMMAASDDATVELIEHELRETQTSTQ